MREEKEKGSSRCNGVDRVPTRSQWPPTWLSKTPSEPVKAQSSQVVTAIATPESDAPAAILDKIRFHGLDLVAEATGRVYLDGPCEAVATLPTDLAESLETHWPAIRRLAQPEPIPGLAEIDFHPPCHRCGSLEVWQTVLGTWRCQACDPPNTGLHNRLSRLAGKYLRQSPPMEDGEAIVREEGPDRPRLKRAARCACDKSHRRHDGIHTEGWTRIVCTDCGQFVGLRPTPRT